MFEFLWKRKSPAAPGRTDERLDAPGTHLRYDAALVPNLIADHHALLGIFGEIGQATQQKNVHKVQEKLGEFGDALRGHLLKENIRFYVYLTHCLQNDAENSALIHDLRKEMMHIGKAVAAFLHKYTAEGEWSGGMWQGFQEEVGNIGKVLVKRIKTEEEMLYPLYMPPENYR